MNPKKKRRLFDTKIEPEYQRVFTFIYARLDRDRELAMDITQDTMELAWNRIEQLKNIESARAWLMQIAMNEIRKYFRAQNAQKRNLFHEESYDLQEFEISENPEQIEADVLETIIAREDRKIMMEAFKRVREKYRILLDLRLIQDLKFSQIAIIMQMEEGTARVYYGRAVKMLDKEYRQIVGEGDK
ncbi:RNA polymerase sigma factor [Anaerovorax odorimutans]|uniref:RNA polymerase sigma factor n=1 Tax=Anaerovorax odorimutans TaxID=109327 RepID=A0ABT1RQA4_9FIRM|nr:RNA polymerase sigma factor [Anaerovorax odorimutans]MCQ4637343.1 RNA polymerase sigma factor [Anaerovorax odorimutans]